MDREQRGVNLQRFDHHRMQYHNGGSRSRSRMPPFGRGGRYSRGQKQFYPPPPPPPVPGGPLAPPPQHRYEVLMEAGRLAAEYLVAKGVLPPASLQRGGRGGGVGSVGWGQLPPPPPPPPPLPPAQEAPAFYEARRNGPQRFVDEYSNPNPRSRRNRGGDYSNSNSSNYNGRGKRKFGAHDKNSEWGRDRERSRGYLDGRSYDDDDEEEEEEDGAPGYRRQLRGSGGIDEVGSSVSGVAGEGPVSKAEAVGESELEDTGSKVSSSSNVRKDADAVQEVQDENEANNMQEDSKVSNSEVVEQGMNGESISNNASSGVVEEAEIKHSPVPLDDKVSDEKPDDSSVLNDKTEHDKASDEKVPGVENNSRDDCRDFLNYCSFVRAPTRPRSILAHRNGAPARRETVVAQQVDLVPPMAIDEAANESSLTNVQGDNIDGLVCLENTDPSIACNQMVKQFQEKESQIKTEDMREQNNTAQQYSVLETKEHNGLSPTLASHQNSLKLQYAGLETKEHNGLSPTLASHQNSLKLQVKEGVQIYNIDTPPQDEDLIDSIDKGKIVGVELLPNIGGKAVATKEEKKFDQSSSFKICDLNLVGSPELVEIRNDPGLGQCSNAVCSMEAQNQQHVDFGITAGNNASNTDRYAQIPLDDKVVQVIDIEDDSPIEPSACGTSKSKSEMVYSSMENIMNPTVNTNVLPGIQDGYNLAISDFLGADMPCFQPIQTDLHAEMGLNDSEVITVMDDPIYASLSDIGFMEVWDQPPPDYAKFF